MQSPILAIDTSDRSADVALGYNDKVSVHRACDTKSVEQLPQLLSRCLDDLQLGIEDISSVCVSMGPGSFTGIRAGVAYGQGICLARQIPLVGVSSLLSRAHLQLSDDCEELVCLTASKTEYFSQRVKHKEGISTPIGPLHMLSIVQAPADIVMLDEISGARAMIKFYSSFADGLEAGFDISNYAQHLVLANNALGIEPLYVKAVAAKTLVERGLR